MDSKTPVKTKIHDSSNKVRVVLRVRPFLPREISDVQPCVSSVIDDGGDRDDASEVAVHIKDPLSW